MTKVDEVLETISSMTVLELSELLKAFEEKFGVTAAPVAAAVAAPALVADAAGAPAEEEKTSFDVLLVEIGEKKIQVIKEVRSLTNLGLKEAKELVDSAPKPVLQGVGREEADKAAESLQAVGASIKVE